MHDARTEAKRWLEAAREDLGYARHAAAGGYHAPASFFAQQAAEKAVKVIHYLRGARAVIGHSVRALIEQLEPPEPALHALLDAARELDLLYIPTRYPNGLASGTPGAAFGSAQSKRAIDLAERCVHESAQIAGF
jgi:HEPN domain-containing protein